MLHQKAHHIMKNIQPRTAKIESRVQSIIHIVVLTLFIFPAITLWAQETSSEKAKGFAEQFFMLRNGLKSGTIQPQESYRTIELQKMYQSPDSVRNPLFCFQNKDAGFVIVSENGGDYMVVGYSATGKFNPANIPEQLKSMLKTYEKTEKFTINAPNNLKSASIVVAPLLDAKGISLNQYNHENVGNCPSGCVATAMVQIMCYYKYPATGTGSNCYTHSVYGQLCADFEHTTYNWTNMTDADCKLLSYHVGVAMNMNYCGHQATNGSIPSASNYENTLQKYFKYNVHYGTSESFYIKSELDNGRPVYSELYGDPGHAVVIDGYDANGYFHLNFGWGGNSNGYYLMNNNSTMDVGYIFGTNIGSSVFISPTAPKTNPQDSLALVSFHNSMNGKTGWDLTQPVVNWPGVLVMNGRVIRIDVANALEGTIPDDIQNLTALQSFSIRGTFTGPFPISITKLTELKELSINYYSNSSKVSLPSEIGNLVNLESLSIIAEGIIPKTIGNLTNLKYLNITGGGLTGEIPDEIYSLTNLENIYLGENQLSGIISPKIGQLNKLKTIELHNNQFSGQLPVEIGNLTELTEFRIAQNQFSGIIPESIDNWTKLQSLYLNNNAFEGMLPNAIGKFTQFTDLIINNNKFAALPDSIGNLTNLKQLIANDNLIISIPASISKLSKLFSLNLTNNKLTTLPDMGTMPALWSLHLSNNLISVLPESIGNLASVSELYLDNNKLTELPSSLENLTTLKDVSVSANKLTSLPILFSLLSNLKHLYIQNNQITGSLPPLKHLGLMDLWVQGNRLDFSDIAASKMPDDSIYTDDYTFLYDNQAKIAVTDSVFSFALGDSVSIDVRKISRLSHPNNVYSWFKNNQLFQSGPILKISTFKDTQKGTYFCRASNTKYKRNLLQLETNPIKLVSKGDSIYTDGFHTTSRTNTSGEVSDYQVKLVIPDGVRGAIDWQASIDSVHWYVVSDTLSQHSIKQNISSIAGSKILVTPKSPVYFRYVVKEDPCNQLFSDVIKIKPIGELLLDTLINVKDKALTISKDSIEIFFPANFTDKDFRLTINKLTNPPASPDSIKLNSVYDVNVSCGSVFDVPLQIKFKNINKKSFSQKDINRYKAVFYNEKGKKWEAYKYADISLKDSSLVFETNHLTKLSWYENNGYFSGYTHIFTKRRVNVIYKYGVGGGEDTPYDAYDLLFKKSGPQSWQDANTDPNKGGNPLMIQDVAEYTNQIIDKFESLGLTISMFNFNVYVSCDFGEAGQTDFSSNLVGRGYIGINPSYLSEPSEMRTTLAHEYTHFTQDYYMQTALINYFWTEATAPLGDWDVWDATTQEIPEPQNLLNTSLLPNKDGKTIFDILSNSWDADCYNIAVISKRLVSSNNANIASTFLHYMRSYRPGEKLKPSVLMKETPLTEGWLNYLNSYIHVHLNSTVGDEFEGFVKYILEGSNKDFTLLNKTPDQDPLKYFNTASDNFVTKKIFKFNNEKVLKDNVKLKIPYLATKMVQLYNGNSNQKIIVKYKRNSVKQDDLKAYICKYDSDKDKMIFEDISEKDSSVFVIEKAGTDKLERKHIAFMLFINKGISESFNVDYDLKTYNIPEFRMVDMFNFYHNWGLEGSEVENLKIHSISNGTSEELNDIPFMAQVFRTDADRYGSMSYNTETTDSTIIVQASSTYFNQTTTYNYLTGKMAIYDWENWSGGNPTIDTREFTMTLNDVWLTPITNGGVLGLTYSFNTKNTAETQKAVQSISYTRKYKYWNPNLKPPGFDPMITYTYLRTTYPTDDIKLYMQFW